MKKLCTPSTLYALEVINAGAALVFVIGLLPGILLLAYGHTTGDSAAAIPALVCLATETAAAIVAAVSGALANIVYSNIE